MKYFVLLLTLSLVLGCKEKLSKGKLFVLDEGGHGGGNPECKNRIINAFMDNPYGNLQTSCLSVYTSLKD